MKRQGFLKSSAILVAMTAVTKAMGLIYKIPLANILGGTGMGHFSAAFSVFTPVLALGVSGICPAMAKLSAENSALGRFTDLRRRRKQLWQYSLLQGCYCVQLLLVLLILQITKAVSDLQSYVLHRLLYSAEL